MGAPTTTIPLEIEPQAAELVADLGLQAEFEQILDYLRQNVKGLINLRVEWADHDHETGQPRAVLISAATDRPFDPAERTTDQISTWKVTTFPPQVCERFVIFLV